MTRTRAVLSTAAVIFTSACGTTSVSLPAPEILSVVPFRMPASEKSDVTISFDAIYNVRVDYGREQVSTVTPSTVRVLLGEQEAAVTSFDPEGVVVATVPRELATGEYAVKLVLEDGREAVSPQSLEVYSDAAPVDPEIPDDPPTPRDPTPSDPTHGGPQEPRDGGTFASDAGEPQPHPEPGDAGTQPWDAMREGDITGYVFDAIKEDQDVDRPFLITVRAQGPRAAHFQGPVSLVSTKGNVSPPQIKSCVAGICTQLVTVDKANGNVKLMVVDGFGARGTSNRLKVKH